jgi:aminoglycoside phosphotransferase (APT) family kinase protein
VSEKRLEPAVEEWFLNEVAGSAPPLTSELIAGGRSNLTFRVEDGAGVAFVLRRPPLGDTLQSAHDMGREFRILSGVSGSEIPVPRPLALCTDKSVDGADFYVMEFVDGVVPSSPEKVAEGFDEPLRRQLAFSLIDTLADLHRLEPDSVNLGELGRRTGYIERQLKRWLRQYEESKTRKTPAIAEVHDALAASIPVEQRCSIVHGDYRLDNAIFGPDASLRAVLDWELCTLGDPLADVGGLMVSWVEVGEPGGHRLTPSATAVVGIPTREEIVARYGERSGLDTSDLNFYMAFALWKLACIGEGVYARYSAGQMGDDGLEVDELQNHVANLVEAAAESLGRI